MGLGALDWPCPSDGTCVLSLSNVAREAFMSKEDLRIEAQPSAAMPDSV
jgi:hypothetical protein